MPPQILILDPDPLTQQIVTSSLGAKRLIFTVSSSANTEKILDAFPVKVPLCSDTIGDESGLMFLIGRKTAGRYFVASLWLLISTQISSFMRCAR
ncbi:MAG: hypothetical protein N2035_06945 [Chthoniobacterales bacterium]|nr:hypothetical protein [Chthoniobacterales bacterium]